MPAKSSVPGVSTRCVSLIQNFGLSLLVLAYIILGGVLFQALEAGQEMKQKAMVRNFQDDCVRELWLITERLNVLYESNWSRLVDAQLHKLQRNVLEVSTRNGRVMRENELHWTFSGAVLYSVTVVTTIGYGNIAPHTAEGKVVTILYALVGVPLMLVCLSNLGSTLAQAFQTAYARLCCYQRMRKEPSGKARRNPGPRGQVRGTLVALGGDSGRAVCSLSPEARQLMTTHRLNPQDRDDDELTQLKNGNIQHATPSRVPLIWRASDEFRRAPTPPPHQTPPVPAPIVLLLISFYLGLGALTFAYCEGWSFLDGAYFSFVALSTIGFGDMVPGQSQNLTHDSCLQTAVCCVYLVIGLVIISMSFSLLQEEVVNKGRHLACFFGLVKKESVEDCNKIALTDIGYVAYE